MKKTQQVREGMQGNGLALEVLVRKIWQQDRLIRNHGGRTANESKKVYSELSVSSSVSLIFSLGFLASLQMDFMRM